MTRVERGDVFWARHPRHLAVSHWFVVVTDRGFHALCVAVMITDARNIVPPPVVLPIGTRVTPTFRLTKESTIHNAHAYLIEWETADRLIEGGVFVRHARESNSDLVRIGREVIEGSLEWEDDLLDYSAELEWNAPDR